MSRKPAVRTAGFLFLRRRIYGAVRRRFTFRTSLIFFCAALAASWPVNAATHASLQLKPASLTLDASHATGEIVMSSLDARTLIFDLETVAWKQDGDTDSFSPASDLVIVPPVYDVRPFQQALVRIGVRERSESTEERAFQIHFREVLPPGTTETPRTLRAPIFIAPSEQRGETRYELERTGAEDARLVVRNESNVHVYLGTIRIGGGNQESFSGPLDAYVLAGNTRTFAVRLAHPLEGNKAEIRISAGGEETTVNATVR